MVKRFNYRGRGSGKTVRVCVYVDVTNVAAASVLLNRQNASFWATDSAFKWSPNISTYVPVQHRETLSLQSCFVFACALPTPPITGPR